MKKHCRRVIKGNTLLEDCVIIIDFSIFPQNVINWSINSG